MRLLSVEQETPDKEYLFWELVLATVLLILFFPLSILVCIFLLGWEGSVRLFGAIILSAAALFMTIVAIGFGLAIALFVLSALLS